MANDGFASQGDYYCCCFGVLTTARLLTDLPTFTEIRLGKDLQPAGRGMYTSTELCIARDIPFASGASGMAAVIWEYL